MTLMNRHVRVSYRPLTQATDSTWGTPNETYSHSRYQRLLALGPLSGEAVLRLQREGFYADWEATAWRNPTIADGSRLVTFDSAGNPDLWFHVVKVLPKGRQVTLMLREINEEQS